MQKFYTGAPARAQVHQEISIKGTGFSSPGEAVAIGPAVQADLGKYANSSTPPLAAPDLGSSRDGTGGADSAESQQKDPGVRLKLQAIRAERYFLLATARRLLVRLGLRKGLEYGHNLHRTAKCKHIRHGGDRVKVLLSRKHKSAFYGNLVTCGSVWACPVCSNKISERRRIEIAHAIDWAYKNGLQPVMVTFTFPHRAWHKLRTLLKQQAEALKHLRAGMPWIKFKKSIGYQNLIRALECTHGEHGWHPHTHELWFVAKDADPEVMKVKILERWKVACARAGLLDLENLQQVEAFEAHSVDVKGKCSSSDYLAKYDAATNWGVDRELARSVTKTGKAKGDHPFGLLGKAADGDPRSARLFLIFTLTMRDTRTRQLLWGPGLKAEVGLKELMDEEIAVEQREEADLLGQLDDDDWHTVRSAGAHADLLTAAESGGWPAILALIERLTLAEVARLEALLAPGRAGEGHLLFKASTAASY